MLRLLNVVQKHFFRAKHQGSDDIFENITNHNSHGKEVKRSVSLTILKDILTICAKKNASENLLKYTNKVKHVCIEFREEMLVISDGLKLCVNKPDNSCGAASKKSEEDVNILREATI